MLLHDSFVIISGLVSSFRPNFSSGYHSFYHLLHACFRFSIMLDSVTNFEPHWVVFKSFGWSVESFVDLWGLLVLTFRGFFGRKMPEKIGTLSVDKIEESKKIKDEIEIRGCWIKFRFLGRCISTRSKVDNSIPYGMNFLANLIMTKSKTRYLFWNLLYFASIMLVLINTNFASCCDHCPFMHFDCILHSMVCGEIIIL